MSKARYCTDANTYYMLIRMGKEKAESRNNEKKFCVPRCILIQQLIGYYAFYF